MFVYMCTCMHVANLVVWQLPPVDMLLGGTVSMVVIIIEDACNPIKYKHSL